MKNIEQHAKYLEEADARYATTPPEYMHSLSNAHELILDIVTRLGVRSVCEIGSEGGMLSRKLREMLERKEIDRLTIIDPFPSAEITALHDGVRTFVLPKLSLNALVDLPAQDLYIVDGDHNHFTVYNELKAIFANQDSFVVMHDVCWPCARRDMYYDPKSVPGNHVREFSYEKCQFPGNPDLVEKGLGSHGYYAVAKREGGEKNGVFAAVETLSREMNLEFASVPALLGIGLVCRADGKHAGKPAELAPAEAMSALLSRLEENRIKSWIAKCGLETDLHEKQCDFFELEAKYRGLLAGKTSVASAATILAKSLIRSLGVRRNPLRK